MNFAQKVTMKIANQKNWLSKKEDFRSGDTVKVSVRIKEGEKERVQVFRGVVIKVQGSGISRAFTVRKISSGVGVERTFPLASPAVEKIEVVNRGKVRRSRLFFLRELSGRAARLNSELVVREGEAVSPEAIVPEAAVESKAQDKASSAKKD